MGSKVLNVAAIAVTVLSTSVLYVGPAVATAAASDCPANHFCAYQDANYGGTKLLDVSGIAAGNNHINVASNKVSSISNNTTQCWLGRDDRQAPLPDHTVTTAAPGAQIPLVGNNDQIDWFDVRDSRCLE